MALACLLLAMVTVGAIAARKLLRDLSSEDRCRFTVMALFASAVWTSMAMILIRGTSFGGRYWAPVLPTFGLMVAFALHSLTEPLRSAVPATIWRFTDGVLAFALVLRQLSGTFLR